MKRLLILSILLLSLSLSNIFPGDTIGSIPGKSSEFSHTSMERSPGKFDPAIYMKSQQEMFSWLISESVPLSPDAIISVNVNSDDLAGLESSDCETCDDSHSNIHKIRIGIVKPSEFPVFIGQLPGNAIGHTPDGGYVWTMAVESSGATALRIHISDISLPPNAEIFIYNLNGSAFGPYNNKTFGREGDFWSNTLSGSVAFLQVRLYAPCTDSDLQASHFIIQDVGYLGEKFLLPFLQQLENYQGTLSSTLEHCSFNEPCVEDAACYSGLAINEAKYAVAHMQWISGAWIYYCSGGLISDTVDSSQIPYFLTANHCISKSKDAKNLECFWQYWNSSCQGACYDPIGIVPRTLGADILSTNKTGDYTLMQLRESPPPGSVYMGWTSEPVAYTDGVNLFRISHPQGAPQAYSLHQVDVEAGTCNGWPRGDWIYSRDLIGATEGGSSGAPVYNLKGQIVGQLSGACGTNVNDSCDSVNNGTVDGAFASYYNSVKQWLNPTGEIPRESHINAIDLTIQIRGKNYTCIASITVLDDNDNPIAGATVTGTFSGGISGSSSAITDSNGNAILELTQKSGISTFSFCIDDISHESIIYNPSSNIETCKTY